jgi:hypothetical protein
MLKSFFKNIWSLIQSAPQRAFSVIPIQEENWINLLQDLYFNQKVGPVRVRLYLDASMLDKPYFRHLGGRNGFLRLFDTAPQSPFLHFMGWIYNFAEKNNSTEPRIPETSLWSKEGPWEVCVKELESKFPPYQGKPFYIQDEYRDPKTGMRIDPVWTIRCECEFNHQQLDDLKPLLLKLRELPSGPTQSWNHSTMRFVNMNDYLAEVINWAKENKGLWPSSVLHQMAEEKSPITKGVYRPYFANLASRTGQNSANQADILYLLDQPAC